jgi:DNA polymerase-3 subunit alpha
MAMHEARFVRGAVERGIPEEKAQRIFTLMAQFADYGFNRSHSFAYAYLAYQTAYLKAHYPAHFFAAVLTNESASAEKVGRYISEMRHFGIALLPPDVNSSQDGFTPVGEAIRYGLGAIKGIGSSAVSAISDAREQGGAFGSIFDFTERVDSRAVNKRVVELLIKAGAFDTVSPERARLLATLDRAFEHGARVQRDRVSGQGGLFGDLLGAASAEPHFLVEAEALTRQQMLAHEKEALGFYASGHPLEDFEETIAALSNIDGGRIPGATHGDTVAMGGMITELATRVTKKGDRFAIFRLADRFGDVKVVCWPEQFGRFQRYVENERPVLVTGRLELDDDGGGTIVVQEIQSLENALERAARRVILKLSSELSESDAASLADLLQRARGDVPVEMEVGLEGEVVRLRLSERFRVNASSEVIRKIRELNPAFEVKLIV